MNPEYMQELLERGVTALENLAKEPEIHVPTYPAVCPHCEVMNPVVSVNESESTGRLAEFVLKCHCLMCSKDFYVLPMQWICVGTIGEAEIANKERAEISAYSDQG